MTPGNTPLADLDYAFTHADIHRAPDGLPNREAIDREIANQVELGVVPKALRTDPHDLDLSMIEAADRRLAAK